MDDMDDMDNMDDMDDMDDMKKVEKSLFQRDSAMAGWLTKFLPHHLPHHLTTPLCFYGFGYLTLSKLPPSGAGVQLVFEEGRPIPGVPAGRGGARRRAAPGGS